MASGRIQAVTEAFGRQIIQQLTRGALGSAFIADLYEFVLG
ncbi:MAG TPA: hypothetical protein VNS63_06235 [Blastocatellia bacterium]|nr:hypothetical protein [Blastocatellia bacterium]